MSISSTKPIEPRPELVREVEQTIQEILKNPQALALARLQLVVSLAQRDPQVRNVLDDHVRQILAFAASLGHEVI